MKIKKFFGFTFDTTTQPGHQSRYAPSLLQATQVGRIKDSAEKISPGLPKEEYNPYAEYNSRQIKEVNPAAWLRKKGWEV